VAIVVLDASVAIAFLDAADPHHSGAVAALTRLQGSEMVLPASAYAEMLVGPARRSRAAMDAAREFVIDLALRVEPIRADIAERAAVLRAAHRALKLPDALVHRHGRRARSDAPPHRGPNLEPSEPAGVDDLTRGMLPADELDGLARA
jgi:predicted nucleic acid-binding protein